MEYCSGGDLAVHMNKLRHDGQRIPERTVLAWTVDMMTGLDYLHSSQIVHRDMKPLNCYITSGGVISLSLSLYIYIYRERERERERENYNLDIFIYLLTMLYNKFILKKTFL